MQAPRTPMPASDAQPKLDSSTVNALAALSLHPLPLGIPTAASAQAGASLLAAYGAMRSGPVRQLLQELHQLPWSPLPPLSSSPRSTLRCSHRITPHDRIQPNVDESGFHTGPRRCSFGSGQICKRVISSAAQHTPLQSLSMNPPALVQPAPCSKYQWCPSAIKYRSWGLNIEWFSRKKCSMLT